jgi:hypothetical protein
MHFPRTPLLLAVAAATTVVRSLPAQATAPPIAAPSVDVSCESWNRFKIRCVRTVVGAVPPHTTKWYVNGKHFPVFDDQSSPIFACTLGQANSYRAVVTDALGLRAEDVGSAPCRSGNP